MTDAGDPELLGRTIAGKYVVEEYLGGGAMGAVYRARQRTLDRSVALKVLHANVAHDPMFVTRFTREAKAASRLDHPNSVRVVDFGEEPDGLLYIAMEYLEGRDLFHVMHEEWPLSPERIARVLMQVLAALAVAHDLGVVHRDLKPENIMILRGTDDDGTPTDVVKVCDFGIAKITDPDDGRGGAEGAVERLTTRGFLVGTPEYMSPEQARGEPLDARSDLYAIGVILYQLLTGRMPFTGDSPVAVILKQISASPDPPHTIYPQVNRELEAVCLRALEKERDARFSSAREMRAALRAAIALPPGVLSTTPPPAAPPVHPADAAETQASFESAATRRVTTPPPEKLASTPPPKPLAAELEPRSGGRGLSAALLVIGAAVFAFAVGAALVASGIVSLSSPAPAPSGATTTSGATDREAPATSGTVEETASGAPAPAVTASAPDVAASASASASAKARTPTARPKPRKKTSAPAPTR